MMGETEKMNSGRVTISPFNNLDVVRVNTVVYWAVENP